MMEKPWEGKGGAWLRRRLAEDLGAGHVLSINGAAAGAERAARKQGGEEI
jgi:hypothetical protein